MDIESARFFFLNRQGNISFQLLLTDALGSCVPGGSIVSVLVQIEKVKKAYVVQIVYNHVLFIGIDCRLIYASKHFR